MAGRELIPPCLFDSAGPLGGDTSITGRRRHAKEKVQKKEKVSGRSLLKIELFLTDRNNRFPSMKEAKRCATVIMDSSSLVSINSLERQKR
jgi:hypothetical protein